MANDTFVTQVGQTVKLCVRLDDGNVFELNGAIAPAPEGDDKLRVIIFSKSHTMWDREDIDMRRIKSTPVDGDQFLRNQAPIRITILGPRIERSPDRLEPPEGVMPIELDGTWGGASDDGSNFYVKEQLLIIDVETQTGDDIGISIEQV